MSAATRSKPGPRTPSPAVSVAATTGESSTQAGHELEAQPLAQALATASALLTCWRLSLPADGRIEADAMSPWQVSMRAVHELLYPAAMEYGNKCPYGHPASLAAMYAENLVQIIESALWNMCSGEAGPAMNSPELDAAARHVQQHLAEALRAVSSGWQIACTTQQGGAA